MEAQRPTPKDLALQALQANQVHQYALAQHAEKLTAELAELDKLLAQADIEDGDSDIECDFYIPGAKPPVGPIRNFSNPESPFFVDAMKRNRYVNFTVRHIMPPKEIEALKAAVNVELRRVEQLEGASSTTTDAQMTDKLNWTFIAEKVSDSSSIKRTAEECKIKWIGDLSTAINREPWSPSELQKLQNIVKKKSSQTAVNWVDVARELGTNRLPLDCMRQSIERPRYVWNVESDQKLMDAVNQYGFSWSLVAKYVSPNLTANQCSTRYLRTLDPTLRRGVWTPEEDERLIAAVAGYGRGAWTEVANAIPGRTNEQCRDRWLSALDPTRGTNKDNEWDDAKDAALVEAVNTNGKKWKVISAQLGHPPTNCRIRYEILAKEGLPSNSVSPVAGPSKFSDTPEDHTPAASARSTPKPRGKKGQPQVAIISPPAAKPARPRPRVLTKTKGAGAGAPEEDDTSPRKNSTDRGKKRVAPDPESPPSQKKRAVQAEAMPEPQKDTQDSNSHAETSSSASPKKGGRRVPEVSSLPRRRSARLNGSEAWGTN